MIINNRVVPTGKRPARIDPRTLKMADYIPAAPPRVLPPPPSEVSWVVKVPTWPTYLNDLLGDCVPAAMGHMIDQWTYFATGTETILTDNNILKVYEDIGGYVPGDPSTDNGADMLTALRYWRKVGVAGHKILAFMALDWRDETQVKLAIELFGNVFLGVQLPVSAQGKDDWIVPNGGVYGPKGQPGSWGGHCIPLMAASPVTRTCVTWGTKLKMSKNFLLDYADEAYAVLSTDWIDKRGLAPSLFDLNTLKADLASIA